MHRKEKIIILLINVNQNNLAKIVCNTHAVEAMITLEFF